MMLFSHFCTILQVINQFLYILYVTHLQICGGKVFFGESLNRFLYTNPTNRSIVSLL